MVCVVVRLQNAIETAWCKAFRQVRQTTVDQPALVPTFDQRAARLTSPALIDVSARTGCALTAIDRDLPRITGA
jgi:hypothetical protein